MKFCSVQFQLENVLTNDNTAHSGHIPSTRKCVQLHGDQSIQITGDIHSADYEVDQSWNTERCCFCPAHYCKQNYWEGSSIISKVNSLPQVVTVVCNCLQDKSQSVCGVIHNNYFYDNCFLCQSKLKVAAFSPKKQDILGRNSFTPFPVMSSASASFSRGQWFRSTDRSSKLHL